MARAAVKAKQQAQRQAKSGAQPSKAGASRRGGGRRKHAAGGNPNQQLFFMKLRRRAKFVYVLLAVLFAITFAFLGVGSGTNGLDQLFSNINIFGGGGTSVSKAQNYVKDNPTVAKGYPRPRDRLRGEGRYRRTRSPRSSRTPGSSRRTRRRGASSAGSSSPGRQALAALPERLHDAAARRAEHAVPRRGQARHGDRAETRSSRPPPSRRGRPSPTSSSGRSSPTTTPCPRTSQAAKLQPNELGRLVPTGAGCADGRRREDGGQGLQAVPEAQPRLAERGPDRAADQAALARPARSG